ncbi:DeoR/GlpR family DNA-binding transcription regulator [Cribrihabitans neustonicus]|uniref:DeoR/GlpR family DNA-binding transcription regulator n=1 Tax=Cribrihabitans neustonicus TaxID=1429085 RepID=UPI003B5C03D0
MPGTHTLSHRELELVDALRRLGGSGRNAELARMLEVSEETVRRTLKALDKAGAVRRVHGGAYLDGPQGASGFVRRISEHRAEKERIAAAVAGHVRDGMAVFLDAGSTTAFAAEALRQRSHLTVVTNSIGVAQTLAAYNGNRVHLLGGEMQGDERGTFGHVAEQQARRFALDLAVLSADALSARHGVLYHNAAEAQLAAVVAECAAVNLVAMAHPKFGETAPHRGPAPRLLDRIVSGRAPGKKLAAALADWGVRAEVAGVGDA